MAVICICKTDAYKVMITEGKSRRGVCHHRHHYQQDWHSWRGAALCRWAAARRGAKAPGWSRPHIRWRLPSGSNCFKSHRFWAPRRRGVNSLWDPVQKKIHFFSRFVGRALYKKQICQLAQERLFLTSKKCALNSHRKEPHAASSGTRFCKDFDNHVLFTT